MKEVAVSVHAINGFDPNILEGLYNFDYIHIDVMDGKFVKSISNNLEIFLLLKQLFDQPIITHLMVEDPYNYIGKIIDHIDYFVFHFEIDENKDEIIKEVKATNRKVGIALNPNTDITGILPYLNEIDLVLIMSVHPGWSGQKFLPQSIYRVNQIAEYKKENNFKIDIDGGINIENARKLEYADILTSASTILNAKDPNRVIQLLKESDENEC